MTRADRQRLRDILEAISQIRAYVAFTHAAADEQLPDDLLGDAILCRFVVMGEAARALSAEAVERIPDVSWSDVVGMRNIVTHEHFRIDWDVVEATVERDLRELETAVQRRLLERD